MLFAFDFSGALVGAAVGAVIGGLVGLILWIVRRSSQKPSDDEDNSR